MNIQQTIASLSLEQKCALLSGAETFKTRGFADKGIPQIWLSDGPHGLRKQAGESDHLGLNPSEPATCFPTAATIANSWDPALGEEIGEALGEEAAAQGVSVLLGPGLNIKRSPLCGRNFEYFSEDPYLAGKMAASYVRGIQKNGVAACPKHFAVNSQETRRMASDSIVDERALREIYLTGFEITVKEGKPKTIMSSYNLVNGEYASESYQLLTDILRKEWGFDGAVVTDWGGSNDHAMSVKCGNTLEMPAPGGDSIRELVAAVQNGRIAEADVDARLAELLALIDSTQPALAAAKPFDEEAHHALARKAAGESVVLLKNEDSILPLKEGARVALIGDFAETPRYQGAGSSVVNTTKLDNLKDVIGDSGLNCLGYEQGFERLGGKNDALRDAAVALAKKAEYALVCLGLDEVQESEGLDRGTMKLAQNQVELLKAVYAANPNTIVLFHAGSAVETPWAGSCKAMVYAALGGQAGAGAMLDVVAGKLNPCGKLTESWPVSYDDTPTAGNYPARDRSSFYRESIFVGYRYYQSAGVPVAFPFGYGLSYTSFAYSDMAADEKGVTVTVTNSGKMAGAEIVQVYVSKPDSALPHPVRELKGFAKVRLNPGESKTVTIPLDDKAFRYWNAKTGGWETEGGRYEICIGTSSENIIWQEGVTVKSSNAPDPYAGVELPHYRSGKVKDVPQQEFEALLGRTPPEGKTRINRNMTFGELKYGRSPIGWIACFVITKLLNASLAKGTPDLNLLFIYNMPLRALAKMTGGMVSMGMVDGIVMELKGFWIIGLIRVIYEFIKNLILNAALEKRLKA